MADVLFSGIDLLLKKSKVTLATALLSLSESSNCEFYMTHNYMRLGAISNQHQLCRQQNNSRMVFSFAVDNLTSSSMRMLHVCINRHQLALPVIHARSAQLHEFSDVVWKCCYWWLLVNNFPMQGQWSQSALKTVTLEKDHKTKSSHSPETSGTQQAGSNFCQMVICLVVLSNCRQARNTEHSAERGLFSWCQHSLYVHQCCTGFSCLSTPSCKPLPMETPVAMFLLYLVLRRCSNSW